MNHTNRIVILVDMDCFYCQVEEKLDPDLEGKPVAVVQYNAWKGGGIIAVNYVARSKGVTRHMRGDDAKQVCPDIVLVRVPQVREKADLSKYRNAGKRVAEVLKTFTPLLERASIDEAYLDITEAVERRLNENVYSVSFKDVESSYIVGYDTTDFLHNVNTNQEYAESNYKLAMGGLITEEIRAEVYEKTGYRCSAGIAHNKTLAKLACGLHKPNKQTILPQESVNELFKDLPIKKIKSLGGKFGISLSEDLNIKHVGDLTEFSEKQLMEKYDEKNAKWLYNIARGIDVEPVTIRLVSKSIGCCKRFPGKNSLVTVESVNYWMNELATEIRERLEEDLEENNRRAKQIVVSFSQGTNKKDISSTRTIPLNSYDQCKIVNSALEVIRKFCLKPDGTYCIKFLGLSAANFEDNKKILNLTTLIKNMSESNRRPIQKINKIQGTLPLFSQKQDTKDDSIGSCKLDNNNTTVCHNVDTPTIYPPTCTSSLLSDNQNSMQNNNVESCEEEILFGEDNSESSDSVYSATTEELNEDMKSLIYYEDIFPESVSSQPIFNDEISPNNLSTHTVDGFAPNHLSNIAINTTASNEMFEIRKSSSQSFFTRYFKNGQTDNISCSSPHKQYNTTSKNYDWQLMEWHSNSVDDQLPNQTNTDHMVGPTRGDKEEGQAIGKSEHFNTCPICSKKILIDDMVSHMDFHYALKIVKEEKHLYNPSQNSVNSTDGKVEKKFVSHGNRKKISKSKPILKFLKKEEDICEQISQECAECNKRIRLEEISDHFDYHTAKKLHLELNSYSPEGIKNKSKHDVIKKTDISKYFNKQ